MAEDEREQPLRKTVEHLVGADLPSLEDLTPDQIRHLVHELQVQNEELIRAKGEIARLTTLYAVLSRVNEAIVRIHGEEALYQDVCRIVAEEGGFPLVWVGRLEEGRVTPAASSGSAADYVKEIRVDVEGEFGRGPTGTCIREERPVVNDDFAINPSTLPWREPALRYGFRASAAFPLRRQGRVVGALTLYAAAPGVFDRDHVSLLEALCADISYALDAMEQEQLRRQAEEALRQLNAELEQRVAEQTGEVRRSYEAVKKERQRLYDVLETLPVYVVLLTPDYHVPFANRFFRERFGESHGQRCFEYLFGRTEPCEICETYKVLKTNTPHHWEWTGPEGRNYDIYDFPFTDTDGSPLIMEMGIDITELKQAERSLKEANETLERRVAERTAELAAARNEALGAKNRLEAMMEALPVGVAIIDARGGNIRSNDMFEKVWGSPRPAATEVKDYKAYKAWWVDTGKAVQPEEWASARAVQKGETVIGQVMEIESFDGVRKFIMNSAAPVHDGDGKITGSAVTIQDISDIKRAEQALRENEAQLQTIFENLTEGLVVATLDGELFHWNRTAVEMHGFASLDECWRRLPDFAGIFELATMAGTVLPVDDWPLARILGGESLRNLEIRIRRLDRPWQRIFSYGGALVRDAEGEPLLAVVSVRDITERKQAEQALQRSVRRFELLAETAGELLETPEPQKIVWELCRRVMERLDCHAFFNFLVDEQAGRLRLNACAGIPPEETRRIEWLDYGVAVCGCVARDRCRIVAEHIPTTPDVRTELVKSYGIKAYACHPLLGAGGRLIGTLSFGTRSRETFSPDDLSLMKAVTDQVAVAMIRMRGEQALRASEEALRQANEQLEGKVRQRTAELVALTQNLTESRDQLRALASDLTLMEARERRALALDLHDTVAQTLAIAKLTLESMGAHLEEKSAEKVIRVAEFVRQAILQTRSLMADLSPSLLYEAGLVQALRALARRTGELHSLAIAVVDDGKPKPLEENYRVLVFRAVQELLHNAVKHAKAKKVTVSLHRADKGLRIEVEDDGVGFLVSERRRGDGKDGAFGLFSVQERMQHLGGSFEVFSRPGKGVRAILLVPLQEEKDDDAGRAVLRILIVDDHRMMRDALAKLLEKEPGFEVVGLAADGREAVRLAREVRPDVVVMDVQMPRMDGIQATRQIVADFPEIKVIGLSVETEGGRVSEMLSAGATAFVPKSSSPEELTEAIRTAVRSIRET